MNVRFELKTMGAVTYRLYIDSDLGTASIRILESIDYIHKF